MNNYYYTTWYNNLIDELCWLEPYIEVERDD